MESHVPSNRNETWTEEKHVHFLNSMEAWFVRTMLQSNDRYNLRLDRHLPDSSDSTLDCKPRTKHSTSVHFIGKTRSKMKKSRPVKRSMRPSSQPHDSSQDQVGDHSLDHLETLMRWFKIKSYRIKLRFTLLSCIHGCGFDGLIFCSQSKVPKFDD
ncbi:hypothetical protein Golax_024195 [Gossypium laxum]|uniref:Uncharacterized protein n=1 Tax=Gossypium laxum TaxID=34288 RepID=A0A7J8ZBJ4_9ROSI|nr:hypothetical protein [Gossypium laxum]